MVTFFATLNMCMNHDPKLVGSKRPTSEEREIGQPVQEVRASVTFINRNGKLLRRIIQFSMVEPVVNTCGKQLLSFCKALGGVACASNSVKFRGGGRGCSLSRWKRLRGAPTNEPMHFFGRRSNSGKFYIVESTRNSVGCMSTNDFGENGCKLHVYEIESTCSCSWFTE